MANWKVGDRIHPKDEKPGTIYVITHMLDDDWFIEVDISQTNVTPNIKDTMYLSPEEIDQWELYSTVANKQKIKDFLNN